MRITFSALPFLCSHHSYLFCVHINPALLLLPTHCRLARFHVSSELLYLFFKLSIDRVDAGAESGFCICEISTELVLS